jgi:hypothetical protein
MGEWSDFLCFEGDGDDLADEAEDEFVNQCTVGAERLLVGAFELVLFDEVPVVGWSIFEEVGEGGAGVPSVLCPS